jgi:hypothetical protein
MTGRVLMLLGGVFAVIALERLLNATMTCPAKITRLSHSGF